MGIKLKQAIYQQSYLPAPTKLSSFSVSGHVCGFHALAVVNDAVNETEVALLQ